MSKTPVKSVGGRPRKIRPPDYVKPDRGRGRPKKTEADREKDRLRYINKLNEPIPTPPSLPIDAFSRHDYFTDPEQYLMAVMVSPNVMEERRDQAAKLLLTAKLKREQADRLKQQAAIGKKKALEAAANNLVGGTSKGSWSELLAQDSKLN